MATRHSVAEVQALLIFCEWPFTSSQRGDMTLFKYSGLAIQLGLCLGLHRPHFVEEFSGRLHKSEPIDLTERSQTWAKCFIVHQTLATGLGLPSCLSDDWVTSTISQSRDNDVEWLRSLHPDISKLLRIQRFVLRMSAVLGNDAQSQSGQYEPTVAPALLALLSSELSDLERGLVPMSHIVSANFLNAKLSLHMFALQRDIAQTSSQDFISCYSTSMRMLTILAELTSNKDSLAMFWPRSIWHTLVISTLCLLKLATIQTLHPEIVPIDRNVVLQEVGRAYNIIMSRSVLSGDNAHRTATLIEFLAKKLASASSPDPAAPAFAFRARMSLGNLLFDATSQLRKARGNHYHKIPPMKPSIQETVPFELPAPSDAPGVVYDPNALMSTFEDFTFTSDMLQGVDPLSEPNYSLLSAENWADMVGDATFADLETLWKADTASA